MTRLALPARPRILVVALRRLGDVLLTTPLIRSLRRSWPDATVDVLLFAETSGILRGNPDVNAVIEMPARPSALQSAALAARLWRRYDLAVSTQSGDRPSFFALVAGKKSAGLHDDTGNGRVKRALHTRSLAVAPGVHRVEEMLQLADAIGIDRDPHVVGPDPRACPAAPDGAYAVIHAAPMFRYKQWTGEGWRAFAAALAARGVAVVATGGPAAAERRYLDDIWTGTTVHRADGVLDWPQLSGLLSKAQLYVGPDTSVTHLAAASGCPTVALYGPTDPRLWGPWPAGGLASPWEATGQIQNRGNVWLVQNPFPCTPCQLEGCERSLASDSQCLVQLPVERVVAAADMALSAAKN